MKNSHRKGKRVKSVTMLLSCLASELDFLHFGRSTQVFDSNQLWAQPFNWIMAEIRGGRLWIAYKRKMRATR